MLVATGYFSNSVLMVLLPPGLRAEYAACDRVAPTGGDDALCLAGIVMMIVDPPIEAG